MRSDETVAMAKPDEMGKLRMSQFRISGESGSGLTFGSKFVTL